MGIIQMKGYSLTGTFLGEFLENVAAERGAVNNIIFSFSRVPHRESVVMSRRDAYISGSGVLDGRHPFSGVEFGGIEPPCRLLVFLGLRTVI